MKSTEIAAANDTFRKSILREKRPDGKAVMTPGIQALGNLTHAYILSLIHISEPTRPY